MKSEIKREIIGVLIFLILFLIGLSIYISLIVYFSIKVANSENYYNPQDPPRTTPHDENVLWLILSCTFGLVFPIVGLLSGAALQSIFLKFMLNKYGDPVELDLKSQLKGDELNKQLENLKEYKILNKKRLHLNKIIDKSDKRIDNPDKYFDDVENQVENEKKEREKNIGEREKLQVKLKPLRTDMDKYQINYDYSL